MYKLPIGIRIPEDIEYPDGYDAILINNNRKNAKIVEGYKIQEYPEKNSYYYAEVNLDANKLWDVFCSLTDKLINDTAYGLIGFKDDEPLLSDFTEKEAIINILEKYKFELTNDGYLEFGIASYNKENKENKVNEIYISSFKYMRIWTSDKDEILKVLNSFGINEVEDMRFIDEFPVVSEALKNDGFNGIAHYSEVIEYVKEEFGKINCLY